MQNLRPIFIRSNFTFTFDGRDYSFLNHGVSVFGVSGIRWPHFDPTNRVGEAVKLTVDVLCKNRYKFTTNAMLTAEVTSDSVYLGAKFYLSDAERDKLAQVIDHEGFYPTNYIRKYPRIPAWASISNMPMRAIVNTESNDLIVFDVANMSPNGILLHSENQMAAAYVAGHRIRAQVEPRGDSYRPFLFDGTVCRVLMDRNPSSMNVNRYLGIRFTRVSDEGKQNFLDILQAVLNKIKNTGITS